MMMRALAPLAQIEEISDAVSPSETGGSSEIEAEKYYEEYYSSCIESKK